MALATAVSEATAGDLAKRATALAEEVTALAAQVPNTDGLYTQVTKAAQNLDAASRQLRKAQARIVKQQLEDEDARVLARLAAQDALIASL